MGRQWGPAILELLVWIVCGALIGLIMAFVLVSIGLTTWR